MALSKRKRAALLRYAQYALIILIAAVVGLAADWGSLRDSFFKPDLVRQQFPDILTTALKNTVLYTTCGFVFGLALGLLLALMRLSSVGPWRWLSTGFIVLFRGPPALVVFLGLGTGFPRPVPGDRIPRARNSVVEGKRGYVRVDPGGR